ncbi:MAG: 3D domain-containing protein [Fimbriimonadaceae bacterium]
MSFYLVVPLLFLLGQGGGPITKTDSGVSGTSQTETTLGEKVSVGSNSVEPQAPDAINLIVKRKPIPYETFFELSRNVGTGRVVERQKGKNGEERRVYRPAHSGPNADHILLRTERTEPTHKIIHMGAAGHKTGQTRFRLREQRVMESTAYHPHPHRNPRLNTGRTATGMQAQFGVVAVDPKVIPLRTLLFVEGYGFAIAADTGGAIKGNKIDVCIPDRRRIYEWGRRKVTVYIFE